MDRQNAQDQIDLINSIVSDKESHYPIRASVLINWSIISAILIYFTPIVHEHYGTEAMVVFLTIFMGLGLFLDIMNIRRINEEMDIIMTPNQKFVGRLWGVISTFAIIMTSALVAIEQVHLIYPLWLFAIGLANYVTGYLFNNTGCKYGITAIFVSVVVLLLSHVIDDLHLLFLIGEYSALVFLSGGTLFIGLQLLSDERKQK
jgi:hypothetical protein